MHYLYLVFFAFSKFRSIKKLMSQYSQEDIVFEKVAPPEELNEGLITLTYFRASAAGYLSYMILQHMSPGIKLRTFTKSYSGSTNCKIKKKLSRKGFWGYFKQSLKRKMNLFYQVSGISFCRGLFLSILYQAANMKRTAESFEIYSPEIKIDEEISEFINIFNVISSVFIKKLMDYSFDYKAKIPKLVIQTPSFIYSKKTSFAYARAVISGKIKVIIFQHGAWYATIKKHFMREIEYNRATFLSWGEEHVSYLERKKVINHLPFPYLSFLSNKYKYKNQNGVLWVTGVHYRAGDGLEYLSGKMAIEYMNKKRAFYQSLNKKITTELLYKSLHSSSEMFPDIMLDMIPKNQQFFGFGIIPCMLKSKIIFLDYYGTPFYEAMSMNAPIVLGLLELEPYFTEAASTIFQKFEEVGVVYRTPEEAASVLNKLDDMDIQKWWNNEKIQTVRREFLTKYANNKPYFWPWCKAILKGDI